MVGKKIGEWTVVAFEERHKGFKRWRCRCSCGNEKSFTTSYLNTNQLTCCNICRDKKRKETENLLASEIIGRKYCDFTVISFVGRNKYGSRLWRCRCKCGYERNFLSSYLFGGGERRATLCKKCHNEKEELRHRVTDRIPDRFWQRFLDQSVRRGISMRLTVEEAFKVYEDQGKECALTGLPLYFTTFRANYNRYTNASIDRIDSDKPYELGNIQFVHKKVNVMKHAMSVAEFVEMCKLVVIKSGGTNHG